MRISDWSSDVCSSDLLTWALPLPFFLAVMIDGVVARALQLKSKSLAVGACLALGALFVAFSSRSGTLLCTNSVALGPPDLKVPPAEYGVARNLRSEEHTSELQSLMRISYAVFCLKK